MTRTANTAINDTNIQIATQLTSFICIHFLAALPPSRLKLLITSNVAFHDHAITLSIRGSQLLDDAQPYTAAELAQPTHKQAAQNKPIAKPCCTHQRKKSPKNTHKPSMGYHTYGARARTRYRSPRKASLAVTATTLSLANAKPSNQKGRLMHLYHTKTPKKVSYEELNASSITRLPYTHRSRRAFNSPW